MKRIAIILILLLASMAYAVPLDMAVTVTGAGDGTGNTTGTLDWDKAMSMTQFIADATNNSEPGDRYFIMAGTYTLAADDPINLLRDGTAIAPISVIGVKAGTTATPPTIADYAYGTDRPHLDGSTNTEDIEFDDYWVVRNIRFLINSAFGVRIDAGSLCENCYSNNDSGGGAGYKAFYLPTSGGNIISCEATAAGSTGIKLGTAGNLAVNCYVHDCLLGIDMGATTSQVVNNVISNCTQGLEVNTEGSIIIGNTVKTCTTGMISTEGYSNVFLNNIFDECTAPATWTTEQKNNWFDYNSWDGRESENTNVTVGQNAIDSDITLNADFTVQASSAVLDAGIKLGPNTGIAGSEFKQNIGADQDNNAASAGGQHSTKQGGKQ